MYSNSDTNISKIIFFDLNFLQTKLAKIYDIVYEEWTKKHVWNGTQHNR